MAPELADRERLRVLVVDDDRDAADSLAMLAELWGHDTRTEYEAGSALDGAHSYRPHVVFLDIGLPRIDGHQLARELRRGAGTETILIAVTGYGDEAHRGQCEAAFDHYLVKPAPVEEMERLLALVKKTLKLPTRSDSDTLRASTTFSATPRGYDKSPPAAPPTVVE